MSPAVPRHPLCGDLDSVWAGNDHNVCHPGIFLLYVLTIPELCSGPRESKSSSASFFPSLTCMHVVLHLRVLIDFMSMNFQKKIIKRASPWAVHNYQTKYRPQHIIGWRNFSAFLKKNSYLQWLFNKTQRNMLLKRELQPHKECHIDAPLNKQSQSNQNKSPTSLRLPSKTRPHRFVPERWEILKVFEG